MSVAGPSSAARHTLIATLTAALVVACGAAARSSSSPSSPSAPTSAPAATAPTRGGSAEPPVLVVLVTVDQLRPDYLTRYGGQLSGGLARLWRGGAAFAAAYQDHAITETAPGHASTLSGRFPRSTGITSNSFGVQDPNYPLVDGNGPGASPLRFVGTTLVDWMIARDKRTRALSVSMKDRGAILPIGRSRQSVFWYTVDGRFTTSRYYADTLPMWATGFNARHFPLAAAGRVWTPLLADSAYAERDSVPLEAAGRGFTFPHALPADSLAAASALRATPWMDELTLAFALDGVRAMRLGAGNATDILAVSLSATDVIGHTYGPDSREIHDQILRLDRSLGAFLDSLYAMRDSARVIVALTADHGVASYPELARARDGAGGAPRWVDLTPAVAATEAWLTTRGVGGVAIALDGGALFFNRKALADARMSPDSVASHFTAAASKVPGVLRVDRLAALARADTVRDAVARRWLHMLPADAPVAAVVTLTEGSVWGEQGGMATHGTPYDYDAHVPLVFYGPPFKPGTYTGFVRVVDLAPTLAAVLGVKPLEKVDGKVLTAALR